ncbi:Aminotransferase class IV [Penicillium macrosclerotiorum]|uniref:Aminotransferase class IV n=1 Tax=Penicillium macrosclerotiorum TaxID=303699 RepID=UPI002548C988|nr:Aminotransferase class IV [Penicillium macrosclerotiorum]KAJ5693154.1 Aminotransferase class IV [Penicillium macrosclerotiorum]
MIKSFEDANAFLPPVFERMVTANGLSTSNPLNASRLKLNLTTNPKIIPSSDSKDLHAHKICTDHMIVARWTTQNASVLHYSTSCFKGMKVHRGFDGKLRLFRPEYNCARMLASARRICLPEFDPRELLKLIKKLCEDVVRSWPDGTRSAKVSDNYAPSLLVQGEAKRRGCDQVLWLFGPEGYVTEAGSANFFAIWRTFEGKLQLVTAPWSDHLILAGVTRQSILDLTRERLSESEGSSYGCEPLEVIERNFTVSDLVEASNGGGLVGAFVVGTACFMQPVVHVQNGDIEIAISQEKVLLVSMIRKWIKDIMFGGEENTWADEVMEE